MKRSRKDMCRVNVLGVGIHAVDIARAADHIEQALAAHARGYVCVTGVHGIMEAQRDPGFRSVLNRALLTVPDGMPTVWIGKLQGFNCIERVFGPDLMYEICRRSTQKGYTHYLFGGGPGVAIQLRDVLLDRFPNINIVGTYTPPFRDLNGAEFERLKQEVALLKPDIFWIGLSTPKQERFMAGQGRQLAATIMIGVGAAFDIHTGRLQDAPTWMKTSGLQWLHRLIQEPGRLWKRYLFNNSRFLRDISLQLLGVKKYEVF